VKGYQAKARGSEFIFVFRIFELGALGLISIVVLCRSGILSRIAGTCVSKVSSSSRSWLLSGVKCHGICGKSATLVEAVVMFTAGCIARTLTIISD